MSDNPPHMASSVPARAILTIVLLIGALGAAGTLAYLRRAPADAPAGDAAAPSDFGGTVHAVSLAELARAAEGGALNTMNLAIDLDHGSTRTTVQHGSTRSNTDHSSTRFNTSIGDTLHVVARAGEPSRCALYHRNARNEYRLFHPESGASFALSPAQRWDSGPLRITEPAGAEFFLLVCRSESSSSINLHDLLEGPQAEWRRSIGAVRADYTVR
jgi:hypothetical protein